MPISFKAPSGGFIGGGSETIDIGSTTAFPTGIESLFEYNGVLINDTTTIEKIRVNEIGGFDDADVRDSRDVNPQSHGETAFDMWYGGRTITLTGRIEAYTLNKLRDMQMGLRQIFANTDERPLTVRTNNSARDAYIYCRKSASLAMKESQGDKRFFRDFMVTLRASNPRWLSLNRNVMTIAPNFASTPVTNNGNFSAEPEFHFIGQIIDLTVTNNANNLSFKINGTIPAGAEYILDIRNKTFKDANGNDVWHQFDLSSDWLEFEAGVNNLDFTISSASGSSQIIIFWNHTFL